MKLITELIDKMHILLNEINKIYNDNMNEIDVRLNILEELERKQKEKNKQMSLFLDDISNLLKDED